MPVPERSIFKAARRSAMAAAPRAPDPAEAERHPIYRQESGAIMGIKARSLKCKPGQEHILRRIGVALVIHWDDLPDELQDSVIDQAALVIDEANSPPPSRVEVEDFLRSVRVT
jgi:hypothetical protein